MQILYALQRFDLRLFSKLYRLGKRRLIIPTAKALSHSGDGYLHVLVPLALWMAGSEQVELFAKILGVALIVERVLYFCLKNSLKRRRPADYMPGFNSLITAPDKFSFPSGHSSAAFLLATCLCLVYGQIYIVMLAWALAVALSRVILGVHFPGDLVAGALMGTSIAIASASYVGVW